VIPGGFLTGPEPVFLGFENSTEILVYKRNFAPFFRKRFSLLFPTRDPQPIAKKILCPAARSGGGSQPPARAFQPNGGER
jgi:hypothetical protein